MNPFFRVLLSFFLFSNAVIGQPNLIYNGSFEVLDTCPPPNTPNMHYFGWSSFSSGDIYTNCHADILGIQGPVPQNYLGFQYPVSGANYAGVETWNLGEFRDYITGTLHTNLIVGKTYCGSIYVSAADTIATLCNDFGIAFTNSLPTGSFGQLLDQITPQIANDVINNPLIDKVNWVQIKGSFIANGNEHYVTLGNFKSRVNSDTVKLIFNTLNQYSSYYYLDDVSLIELKALHSADTLVCPQTTFSQSLQAYPDFDSYVWSTGDTTRIIQITQPGQYWVRASNWCGTITDTIHVNVFNPFGFDQMLGPNKGLCDYQFPQRLRPLPQYENTFFNYQWSTGSDTSFADVLLPGTYYVTAEHYCGFVTDSITLTLNPNPLVNLGNDTSLCVGQQVVLDAGLQTSYTWSTQSASQIITVNEAGLFGVTVSNQFNCIASDEIQLNFTEETATFLPNDTALYAGSFPYVITLLNQYSNYNSQGLVVNGELILENEGVYVLSAVDANGCLVKDSITISLKKFELIVPSLIKKDQNFIINNLPVNSRLKVFDALGQIVYQHNNYQNNFMPLVANAMYFVELVYVPSGTLETAVYKGKLMVVD